MTLYELNSLVREAIEDSMAREYWVEAEVAECREARGHCYLELIEKDKQTATPIAKASAKCWASKWAVVKPYFERTTGQRLVAGMKVLLKVYPQFHEAFGFSWIVTDIDPTYTLGDMARQRQAIIRQLKAEGVFDLQKELTLSLFCQRIAVISSETAAGYGDFCHQLAENPYGFQFQTWLFPAVMQGEEVEGSVINALMRIYDQPFDCVVIIRGGGATSDLSGFDTLALAEHVANFPIPIITGIGHERDECILDMVSHTRVKTPTAAAALLVEHLKEVWDAVEGAQERLTRAAQQRLAAVGYQLTALEERMPLLIERRLLAESHRLELMAEKIKGLDPAIMLGRGYSITMCKGKVVRDASTLVEGDEIETRLEKGVLHSVIQTTPSPSSSRGENWEESPSSSRGEKRGEAPPQEGKTGGVTSPNPKYK